MKFVITDIFTAQHIRKKTAKVNIEASSDDGNKLDLTYDLAYDSTLPKLGSVIELVFSED